MVLVRDFTFCLLFCFRFFLDFFIGSDEVCDSYFFSFTFVYEGFSGRCWELRFVLGVRVFYLGRGVRYI